MSAWNAQGSAHDEPQRKQGVPVRSPIGQAQLYMDGVPPWPGRPEEYLLLCRYANTIDISCGQPELRQLERLRKHLDSRRFEEKHGRADPLVAREVEREIIQRLSPDYAAGHDLTPAMRLLAGHERSGPIFTQPERNLLLRAAFDTGDNAWVERIAWAFQEKACSRRKLIDICRRLEQAELCWLGLESMDGLCCPPTYPPGFRMDMRGCEDPMKHYPPFASYPSLRLPSGSVILLNGTLLRPAQDGWWRSGIRKVDQTFTAPHFYKEDGLSYQIADEEHQALYQQQRPEPEMELTLGGIAL